MAKPGSSRVLHDILWRIRLYLWVEAARCDMSGPVLEIPVSVVGRTDWRGHGFSEVDWVVQERAEERAVGHYWWS